jgi:transcriptional regulator with XRE-family HTH domain
MIKMKSNDPKAITGAQLRAARALLNISAQELANLASVGVATIRRAEANNSSSSTSAVVENAIISALENAGVELIAENGGGVGVRLIRS